jgi:adenosylhomocysteine nucleosidase
VLGIVVGLAAEARLARGLAGETEPGGGTANGATAAASRLVARGATALLSFGLAGGLQPGLPAGTVLVPLTVVDGNGKIWQADQRLAQRFGEPSGSMLASDSILTTIADKRTAWERSGALGVDIESGAVARIAAIHGLPFAVLRAVCDPAERNLPPAALTALDPHGRIQPSALLRSLARHPDQIPALIALGREASRARTALLARVKQIRPLP